MRRRDTLICAGFGLLVLLIVVYLAVSAWAMGW